MDYILETTGLKALAATLTNPVPSSYSQYALQNDLSDYPHLQLNILRTASDKKFLLISNKQLDTLSATIVYVHGHSSNAMEGAFLVPYLGTSFSLVLFDMRGHGSDTKSAVTYGIQQVKQFKIFLKQIQDKLKTDIVVWGRSLGGYVSLRASSQLQGTLAAPKCTVADSAFMDFQKLGCELLVKKLGLSEFMSKAVVNWGLNLVKQTQGYDLTQNSLEGLQMRQPTIFLSSPNDDIVPNHHTEALYANHMGYKQLIQISQGHNETRPLEIVQEVLSQVKRLLKRNKATNMASRDNSKSRGLQLRGSLKKPIELSPFAKDPHRLLNRSAKQNVSQPKPLGRSNACTQKRLQSPLRKIELTLKNLYLSSIQ